MAKAKWTRYDMRKVVDKAMAVAMVTIGLGLERAAKMLAPVKTGRLEGSITYATKTARSNAKSPATQKDAVSSPRRKHRVYVGTNVEYAPHVEYGTNQMRRLSFGTQAQPFLRPALDDNRKNIRDILSKALSEGFRRGK